VILLTGKSKEPERHWIAEIRVLLPTGELEWDPAITEWQKEGIIWSSSRNIGHFSEGVFRGIAREFKEAHPEFNGRWFEAKEFEITEIRWRKVKEKKNPESAKSGSKSSATSSIPEEEQLQLFDPKKRRRKGLGADAL
jgi:ABC-type taurine transport system substrate-binding protein